MDFSLTMGNRQVGKVQLLKEGLYARIICRAELYGSVIYRLVAVSGGKRENIGILVPVSGGYGLDRRIPEKRISGEDLSFQLVPSHEPLEGKFVPISPEEPFPYLERLKNAYLAKRQESLGVIIPQVQGSGEE